MKWLLITMLMVSGCTMYHARVGDAELKTVYFMQDKDLKLFVFDPNNETIRIEGFGSETSQIVEAAIAEIVKKGL